MNASIRTFRAADARGALQAVKAALGPDAVILSTRQVSGGWFRSPQVEVTAALPPPEPVAAPPPPTPPPPVMGPAASAAPAPRESNGRVELELSALRDELLALRHEVQREKPAPRAAAPVSTATRLTTQLEERGMEPQVAKALVEAAGVQRPVRGGLQGLRSIQRTLAQQLHVAPAPWLSPSHSVLALVGPTGVGKTTTLAKLAARALMEGKKRVALVTLDTYRIGASEQVSHYARIMGLPFRVARTSSELQAALRDHHWADLVLVDTAGRSLSEAVAQQAELLRAVDNVSLCVAVSAAQGWRDLAAVGERYRRLSPTQLIVTKSDEAVAPAGLLSVIQRLNCPVVAVTNGQRVPEDLFWMASEELAAFLLGPGVGSASGAAVEG